MGGIGASGIGRMKRPPFLEAFNPLVDLSLFFKSSSNFGSEKALKGDWL